ncbi:hypothetical protein HFO56_01480 [Rhizobium laguerreae]|nr:hypothetical protein [Rhizobium laguerreae]
MELDEPWLAYAGAMICGNVIAVDGIHHRRSWSGAWAAMSRDPFFVDWDADELPFVFTSPAHQRFSIADVSRMVDAMPPAPFLHCRAKNPERRVPASGLTPTSASRPLSPWHDSSG